MLTKLLASLTSFKLIVVVGQSADLAVEAIYQVVKKYTKVRKIEKTKIGLKDLLRGGLFLLCQPYHDDLTFWLKKSKSTVLVVTHIGDPPPDRDFFDGDLKYLKPIIPILKSLLPQSKVIVNFDDETVRDLKNKRDNVDFYTFGFQEGSDFRATDVLITKSQSLGTNFKINHRGNIVPVWLNCLFGKENIYAALAAASCAILLDLNLLEISEALASNFRGLPGRMRLIPGIKNSQILDDSYSTSVYSMAQAIDILGKIEAERKIAVLGDILGVGKYAIEAHESLGERIVNTCDLLFTVGPRAKFIAKGARQKGFNQENIFSFDIATEAIIPLKEKIKEKDLILIDGSTETKIREIVEALRIN